MDFETKGKKIDEIPVEMNYRIIELFSAGLYSSPNKAFEELVCNSYDADAENVSVYIPSDKEDKNSVMWVCDNGSGMDSEGLKQLWKIGKSKKREEDNSSNRIQIGKFGIGKLATYVLAKKLTHICKRNGKFLSVTMDYSRINPDEEESVKIKLNEMELTEEEVKEILEPLINIDGQNLLNFNLWGEDAANSWTIAIMSNLREKASKIQDGRLKWILSTALPLNPQFNLIFNGQEVKSSKIGLKPDKTWIIGQKDKTIERIDGAECSTTESGEPSVNLPNIKDITGKFELYPDSLVKGKSQDLGRSHGIFLMVRQRLINVDNPLIGDIEELNHAVFNRCRITVNADELDEFLTSARENISDSEAFNDLKNYIKKKFNDMRAYFLKMIEEEAKNSNPISRISKTSTSLSKRPLLFLAKKYFDGEIDRLFLTEIPPDLKDEEKESIIKRLTETLTSEESIIKDVDVEPLGLEQPIAKLNLKEGKIKLNLLHPFISNFLTEISKSMLPFKLIAANEILTEAFMIEDGIDQDTTFDIMQKRDLLLREVIYNNEPNAPYVAQLIQAATGDPSGLEDALYHAFGSLGFNTTKIGGNGEPDGLALATARDKEGIRRDYSITYDAKSTGKDKVKNKTVGASTIKRHKDKYSANYAVVVAIDFEGAEKEDSAVNIEAKTNEITLLRAKDLWQLILLATPKQLNLLDLEELFKNCKTVIETSEWIEKLKEKEIEHRPIKELLETTYELSKNDDEVTNIHAIRASNDKLKEYSITYLIDLVKSLQNIVGHLISINQKEIVSIQAKPEKILEHLDKTLKTDCIPPELMDIYLKAFEIE